MTDIQNNTNEQDVVNAENAENAEKVSTTPERKPFIRGQRGDLKKNKRTPLKSRKERVKSEFDSKILDIRRVARVSKGGRRFNFSVVVIAGDKKGRVGVGTGKAGDTALAVDKATKNAKKNMIRVNTTKSMSIPYDVTAKYCSARVMIMPAKGRGVIAGSALRDIVEYAGLNDINAKILSGSKNKLNIARASIKALEGLRKLTRK